MIMNRLSTSCLAAMTLLLGAAPAFADDPGGGGTKPPIPVTGEQVYRNVCQACHMADGKGASGAATIPALANNKKLAVSAYPIMMVAGGQGAMPWFTDVLSPAQIANVVTYIRTHFGNTYTKPVTAEEVAQMMPPPPTAAH
jgi:mono/diheme cytochrome c family protein